MVTLILQAAPAVRAKRRVARSKTNALKTRSIAEIGDRHVGKEKGASISADPSNIAVTAAAAIGVEPTPTEAKQACELAARASKPIDDLTLTLGNSIMFELETD